MIARSYAIHSVCPRLSFLPLAEATRLILHFWRCFRAHQSVTAVTILGQLSPLICNIHVIALTL